MDTKNVERYLNQFGKKVADNAKKNLSKAKGSTALEGTIRSVVSFDEQGFNVKFYMADYGTFLDKGVSGNKKDRAFINLKGERELSPYKYTTKGPPIDILSKWIKKKGIKPNGFGRGRSKKTGQYVSAFAYLISRKIKREGIKSISFFQKPLGIGYEKLKTELLKEMMLDIQTYITTFTKHK